MTKNVLYVFYDFQPTKDTKRSDTSNEHVPNLVNLQKFYFQCENLWDIEQDFIQCDKRMHSFWDDPVGDMLSYMSEFLHWVGKIIVNAHNAKDFDHHFILNRAILLK